MPHCRKDIYVTHDCAETDALAARVAQMEANRIVCD
jgi:ABC-type proline/glycine betaine transport system ATPase subunit